MRDKSDVLTVSFDSGLEDKSALLVARKLEGKTIVLKMEVGEQADILYHLLTEQMVEAEIKPKKKKTTFSNLCNSCTNARCEFQSGIVRDACAFYMPPYYEPDNCGNYVVTQP